VFAFSALWFAHYLLSALQGLRALEAPAVASPLPADPLRVGTAAPHGGIAAT
jgi:hypothetical protein